MGLSYPLVASISGSAAVPLSKGAEGSPYHVLGVPTLLANLDVGLGGGMVSGGLAVPLKLNVGYGTKAISFKGAAIRTWLIDVGVERNRTYTGGLTELFFETIPIFKLGLGYFRATDPSHSPRDSFVFFYAGLGL